MMYSSYLNLLVFQWESEWICASSAYFPSVVKEQGGLGFSQWEETGVKIEKN